MKSKAKSQGRAQTPRRLGGYRPQLLPLESRLPLGDALLGLMAGSWLLGPIWPFPSARSAAVETATGNTAVHTGPAQTPGSSCWDEGRRDHAAALIALFRLFAEDPFEVLTSDVTGALGGQHPNPSREKVTPSWPEEALPVMPATAPREIAASIPAQPASAAHRESSPGFVARHHDKGSAMTSTPLLTTAAPASEAALLAPAALGDAQPDARPAGSERPNFLFLITDDQDIETLQYMPRLHELLVDQGMTFTNMFVTEPLCCPSHVSILTGQYPHNHGILSNNPPLGGWQKFHDAGQESSTFATWLQDAGYYTGRFGKYLVGYDNTLIVPPGWSEWNSLYGGVGRYFNYSMNVNGTLVRYGNTPDDYSTDVLREKVVNFIEEREANDDQPWLTFFSPSAPHGDGVGNGPATPAPRHQGAFADLSAPRPPSFNEADVSDKPPSIRNLPLLSDNQIQAIDREYRTRLESLLAVDEAIERIVDVLAAHGELENTYIFFTSDNGYHLGQHRLRNGKNQIYEEDIRVPLIVRGPGVPAGVVREQFVLNIDFAPTLAQLGQATAAEFVDGRSLVPLLQERQPRPWRADFLVEIYGLGSGEVRGLRTEDMVYVEFTSGSRELYDLRQDPYQLDSLHDTAPPGQLRRLSRRLEKLATCAEDTCRR